MPHHFVSPICVSLHGSVTPSRAGLRAPGAGKGMEGKGRERNSAVVRQFCGSSVVEKIIIAARRNARGGAA